MLPAAAPARTATRFNVCSRMSTAFLVLLTALVVALATAFWQSRRHRELARERTIRSYVFPPAVLAQFREHHPFIDEKGLHLVGRALRQFFLVHSRAKPQRVTMPSKAADALWHAFILDTQAYTRFCDQAFGAYLHHVPAQAHTSGADDEAASWLTWRLACLEENIHPARASRLPLLHAVDSKLGFPGATAYDPASFKPRSSAGSCSGGGDGGGSAGPCDGDGGGGGGCGGE